MFILSVVCCYVEFLATDRSLVQRSPAECVVSEYEREASIMGRPWPTGGLMGHAKECRILINKGSTNALNIDVSAH
jgi:hypothetical protein